MKKSINLIKKIWQLPLLTLLFSISTLYSQKILTIEDYVRFTYPLGQLSCSADNSRIAFVVKRCDTTKNQYIQQIWTTPINPPRAEPAPLFPDFKHTFSPQFSPEKNSNVLAFLGIQKDEKARNQNKYAQLYFYSPQMNSPQIVVNMPFGIEKFIWSTEGNLIAFTTKQTFNKKELEEWNQKNLSGNDAYIYEQSALKKEIWLIDLETRKSELIFAGDYGILDLAISPDGEILAFSTNYTGLEDDRNYDLWLLPLGTRQAIQLTDSPGFERAPEFSPDGRYIAFLSEENLAFQLELGLISLTGDKPEILTKNFDENIKEFFWEPSGEKINFLAQVKTEQLFFEIELSNKKIKKRIDFKENSYCHDMLGLPSGNDFCFIRETTTQLPEICISDQDKFRTLTNFSNVLNAFKIVPTEKFSWKDEKGDKIDGLLIKPVNSSIEPLLPMVVVIHGGPFSHFTERLVHNEYLQLYAQQNYLVFAPNPQGSVGYGAEFARNIQKDIGGRDYRQIIAGVDRLIKDGLADSAKMVLVGGSYGGYLVNWTISQTSRFKAAVSLYGIFNLVTDWGTSQRSSWQEIFLGEHYWQNPDLYRSRSPATFVEKIETPLLLLHGENDQNTYLGNSLEAYRALKKLKKPVELVIFPRENHGINREPNHEIDKMKRILNWFEKNLETDFPE